MTPPRGPKPPRIIITASDVQLFFDGHSLTGGGTGTGVWITGDRVSVTGGEIRSFAVGVLATDTNEVRLTQIVSSGHSNAGIALLRVNNGVIVSCSAAHCVTSGIYLFATAGCQVLSSNASNNRFGITVDWGFTGNLIHGNQAFGNSHVDLYDASGNCDANLWRGNQFGTSFPDCIR